MKSYRLNLFVSGFAAGMAVASLATGRTNGMFIDLAMCVVNYAIYAAQAEKYEAY